MSLINEALKKLETAKDAPMKPALMTYHHVSSQDDSAKHHIVFYFFTLVLLLLLASFCAFIFYQKQMVSAKLISQPAAVVPKTPVLHMPTKPRVPIPAITVEPVKNTQQEDANALFQEALADTKANQAELAIQKLYKVIDLSPENNKAREMLVVLLMQTGLTEKANLILQNGLALSPTHIPFIQLQANLLMQSGKKQEALALLNAYSPDMDSHRDYYRLKASLDEMLSDYADAIVLYHELLKQDPQNGVLWLGLGVAYQGSGKNNEANQAFLRAFSYGGLSAEQQAFLTQQLRRS